MSDIKLLDAFEVPLYGLNLVEAAAGTGKTYNIQILVARMILERSLRIDEIVLLSYTIEAAAELQKRVRTILEKILALLENIPAENCEQAKAVLDCDRRHRPETGDEKRIIAIRSALRDFDLANISTINGFCQKLLCNCAFESGTPFELQLENSGSRQLDIVLDDWFRSQAYSGKLSAFLPGLISRHELNALKPCITDYAVKIPEYRSPDLENAVGELLENFDPEKTLERVSAGFFRSKSTISNRKDDFKKALVDRNFGWISELCPLYTPENLCKNALKESRNEVDALVRAEPFFKSCEVVANCLEQARAAIRAEAIRSARARFLELEEQQGFMTFADQIRLVDEALLDSEAFKKLLQNKYKVGIIDEFQDTDAVQYRIFKTIFDRDGATLFLVGDPRQAIYRFRGGDINVYLKAKADALAGGNVYLLNVNYRSSVEMVRAVNQIFGGRENPFSNPDITFDALESRPPGEAPEMLSGGVSDCWAMRRYKMDECSAMQLLEHCAARIKQLVAADSKESFPDGRPVTPGDIAVLLNSHSECHKLRMLLEQHRIPGVCLKGFNIYAGEEAAELYQLLNAVIYPCDRQKVNTALCTTMCGVVPEQLCNGDDELNSGVEKFCTLHDIWFARGFAPMFEEMLRMFNIREHLAERPNGERHLTNLFHLEELLQNRTVRQHLSPDMLLDEFGRRIAVSGDRDELEEDFEEQLSTGSQAVKIMTIHASKGLQFPVVMLPGLQQLTRPADNKLGVVYFDGESRSLNLDNDEEKKELIRNELFEEMLRLIYVAVTRAEYRCEIFESSALSNSAWDYLVNDEAAGHTVGCMPPEFGTGTPGSWENTALLLDELPEFPEHIPHWQVISYSFLADGIHSSSAGIPLDHDDSSANADGEGQNSGETALFSPFTIPGGSGFGSVLHEIFEKIAFNAPESSFSEAVSGVIRRFMPELAPEDMKSTVLHAGRWLHGIMHCRIDDFDGGSFTLAEIAPSDRLSELEFYCGLGEFDLAGVRRVLDEYVRSPELAMSCWPDGWEKEICGGILNGFIDLVFRRNGKYYIADWKSNRLDGIPGNFTPEALKKEMVSSFYFIQYLLYTVALVRHLRRFNGGCFGQEEYEASFGGIYYFFVRGMAPEQNMNGVFRARPPWSVIKALEDLICTGM